MKPFLFEIGVEEIPARMMAKAASDLKQAVSAKLEDAGLLFETLEAQVAPRQIALWSHGIQPQQPDRTEWILGPPVKIAYKPDGSPSPALEGFMRKFPDLDRNQLQTKSEAKGDVVAAERFIAGSATRDLLASILPEALSGLHFAKNMRWGQGEIAFVRPVHSLLALFDGQVIPFQFAGIQSSNTSFGIRFHGKSSFVVSGIEDYQTQKAQNGILINHAERRTRIQAQMQAHAQSVNGQIVPDEALLDQICDLVESPYVVLGAFDAMFLEVPREVLITSLREHQKSFCLQDEKGQLMPYFLAVASVPGDPKGLIRKGNEWVLRARLWDAKFFWDADKKKDWSALREKLAQLMFQRELGSYLVKVERMERLAEVVANHLGLAEAQASALWQACHHAKTDLMSELVFEFTELQGQIGGLLLKHHGAEPAVSEAVYDHYLPVSNDGEMPRTLLGNLVSLIDKLDTLVGCFSVGLIPTGTKDPFALRRAAQGIVRILMERGLPLGLEALLDAALALFPQAPAETKHHLLAFFLDRTRFLLKQQGFDHFQVEAVVAVDANRIDQCLPRIQALAQQMEKDHFRALVLNLKRMKNAFQDEQDQLGEFDPAGLTEAPEKALWSRFSEVRQRLEAAIKSGAYSKAMDEMAVLADPVESYFGKEGVFVNVDDAAIRLNRKAMLREMSNCVGQVADFTLIESK
ncbi:MAG: glycine--tRNA ligase subunit beta [Acidobacteria bacterium]|nr:glycine--tRNA ligase subunit beta [Acidobacteriota bacterium]MCB9396759.1 glycine--tRNA ligase subunit beta [Acidobacteriota bacterium]